MDELCIEKIADVDLHDAFFDTLRADYDGFDAWFSRKAAEGERAYVFRSPDDSVGGFLYLKIEEEPLNDISPSLPAARRLKIGTFKVNPHGTRLGERFIKKALDGGLLKGVEEVYVTVFPKHATLIELFERYGFKQVATKKTPTGTELVLSRRLLRAEGDILERYPLVSVVGVKLYLLAIYPKFHTRLFPDSKLLTEGPNLVLDLSHTNSIHKIYLTSMGGTENLRRGDVLLIYRTRDGQGPAEYRAVATSVGVVEERRHIDSFSDREAFLKYCSSYSVFTDDELRDFWDRRLYPQVIRFTYNAALPRRPIRKELIDHGVIARNAYAGFIQLNETSFKKACRLGQLNEDIIVDKA